MLLRTPWHLFLATLELVVGLITISLVTGLVFLRFDHVFADLVQEDGTGGRSIDPAALDRLRPLVRPTAAGGGPSLMP
jgi:hypothetical protein